MFYCCGLFSFLSWYLSFYGFHVFFLCVLLFRLFFRLMCLTVSLSIVRSISHGWRRIRAPEKPTRSPKPDLSTRLDLQTYKHLKTNKFNLTKNNQHLKLEKKLGMSVWPSIKELAVKRGAQPAGVRQKLPLRGVMPMQPARQKCAKHASHHSDIFANKFELDPLYNKIYI